MSRSASLCSVGVLALLLSGCTGSLPADAVAAEAEDALEDQLGFRPDIACPEDVPKEEGATARCVMTAGDDDTEYGVTITVTGTEDGATFDVQVDDEPMG